MTIELKCNYCGSLFLKQKNEYTRRIKSGKSNFYCSRSCAGNSNGGWAPARKKAIENGTLYDISKHAGNRGKGEFVAWAKRVHQRTSKSKCNLTAEYLESIWTGKCAITNIDIVLTYPSVTHETPLQRASLDRIVSSKGYEIGNVQWVCLPINLAKSNYSQEEILKWLLEVKNN